MQSFEAFPAKRFISSPRGAAAAPFHGTLCSLRRLHARRPRLVFNSRGRDNGAPPVTVTVNQGDSMETYVECTVRSAVTNRSAMLRLV